MRFKAEAAVMKITIESLEGRTLFAAGPGLGGAALLARAAASADPAVQATFALVQADGAAITTARQQIQSESTTSGPALKDVLKNGAELLATDRAAVRAAKDDPTALDAARAKIKADRQQLRDDVAAARTALRTDTADGRAALRDALSSLRTHLKQLRTDLRAAAGATPTTGSTTSMPTTSSSNAAGQPNAMATTPSSDAVVDQIDHVAQNATPPDKALVRTLVDDFVAALSDHQVSDAERDLLRTDARAVLGSAHVSTADLRTIADDVAAIARSSNLSASDLLLAARELQGVFNTG
jgi:hypothetical protein